MKTTEPPVEGIVIEALPSLQFKVQLAGGRTVRCFLSGKMKMNHIRVLAGDRVRLIVSGDIGRIERRL